jgi:prefoldin subunit 5
MGNLSAALQQLREERKQMQSHVEKLDQAISVIESLNGSRTVQQANRPE